MISPLLASPLIFALLLRVLVAQQTPVLASGASSEERWQRFINAGKDLLSQARYVDAERSFRSAVHVSEQEFGGQDSRHATSLNQLAVIAQIMGKYEEAHSLFGRALGIWQQHPERERLNLAIGLSNMANLLRAKGQYAEAESLCLQALHIEQTEIGLDNPTVAETLYGLAAIYASQGRYAEAESSFKRTLEIQRKTVGPDHPSLARTLSDLVLSITLSAVMRRPNHLSAGDRDTREGPGTG